MRHADPAAQDRTNSASFNRNELSIHRMHPDLCDGHFPEGKVVTWTRKDLGIEPGATLRLVNMIGDLKG